MPHTSLPAVLRFTRLLALFAALSTAAADEPAALPRAWIDGTAPGWRPLGPDDFVNVNCADDTWSWVNGEAHCTGQPVGVMRTKQKYTNFELVTEWRHLKPKGNSGVFLWMVDESLKDLAPGKLPHGIEVQVLDLAYETAWEAEHGKPSDWFTSHGDVFPTGTADMTPFPPVAPNGKRAFPRKRLVKPSPEWNHYYIRAIDGEVRLWANGEEVSGGTGCKPASGYLALESEGSPVEFRNLRIRELPPIDAAAEPAKAVAPAAGAKAEAPAATAQQQAVAPATANTAGAFESRRLANIRQVTIGLPRAGEGYFSPDGEWIVYQAYPEGYPFYQIYVQPLAERVPRRISPGRGRTTCAYFSPDGQQILFASAHTAADLDAAEKQARDEAAAGGRPRYQWDFDPAMEIYACRFDGTELHALTNSPGYDAEGSYSHDGRSIVFTSTRDGDPDLYVMDADGKNVRQLTNAGGYDGGPFFSPDDQWVIFRSDRQEKDMLQLYAIRVDGAHETQLTDTLTTVNWAPYFHPSGKQIIWTMADYSHGPRSANFDLFTMEVHLTADSFTGGPIERITDHPKADVLPVFSPDGKQLMWTSTRTGDGSSQLWIADWLGA